jgi:hypothetical protein
MATTYTLISSVTVGSGGAANIEFTSIPATYTDLVVKLSVRDSSAANANAYILQFNNDTTIGNYKYVLLYGINGSTVGSETFNQYYLNYVSSNNATASTFSNTEIYIPNYTSSNFKSASQEGVGENNASDGRLGMDAYLWSSTSAITSLKILPSSGGATYVQHSTAYLYGISNA